MQNLKIWILLLLCTERKKKERDAVYDLGLICLRFDWFACIVGLSHKKHSFILYPQ
jgi:hypothetical protein